MFQAKLACIAAAEAAKPKTSSVKVKPISGVTNQGGTIVFGGGRTLLHFEEVQELQSPLTLSECRIIFSIKKPSNVSTDFDKNHTGLCALGFVLIQTQCSDRSK